MTTKTFIYLVILYGILIGLFGSTGFAGTVWYAIYIFAVCMVWVGLIAGTISICCFVHPVVQDTLAKGQRTNSIGWFSTIIGFVIAFIWLFALHSRWMAAGQMIIVIEAIFVKTLMLKNRGND